jgi:hypothetical protein
MASGIAAALFRKATFGFVMSESQSVRHLSVRPHGTTGPPLDGFSRNFRFQYFPSKLCLENSGFIKNWQEYRVFYVKTSIRF